MLTLKQWETLSYCHNYLIYFRNTDLESTVAKVCDKVLEDDDDLIKLQKEGRGNLDQGINGNNDEELANKGKLMKLIT